MTIEPNVFSKFKHRTGIDDYHFMSYLVQTTVPHMPNGVISNLNTWYYNNAYFSGYSTNPANIRIKLEGAKFDIHDLSEEYRDYLYKKKLESLL